MGGRTGEKTARSERNNTGQEGRGEKCVCVWGGGWNPGMGDGMGVKEMWTGEEDRVSPCLGGGCFEEGKA